MNKDNILQEFITNLKRHRKYYGLDTKLINKLSKLIQEHKDVVLKGNVLALMKKFNRFHRKPLQQVLDKNLYLKENKNIVRNGGSESGFLSNVYSKFKKGFNNIMNPNKKYENATIDDIEKSFSEHKKCDIQELNKLLENYQKDLTRNLILYFKVFYVSENCENNIQFANSTRYGDFTNMHYRLRELLKDNKIVEAFSNYSMPSNDTTDVYDHIEAFLQTIFPPRFKRSDANIGYMKDQKPKGGNKLQRKKIIKNQYSR